MFFCCLCVFLYFNHYITLYYSFQFNIIIHTHGSPGWLLLISVFFFVYFLIFLKRELVLFVGFLSFAYFPYRSFFPLFLLNMYLWISRSLLFTLLLYQLLLMLASIRICSAACPSPPLLERKSKKNLRPSSLSLSSLLSFSLATHNHHHPTCRVKLSGWRSSAGWTASQDPRTDRRRWLRRSPECTSCGSAASAGPACR